MSGGRLPGERCLGMDQDNEIKKGPDDVPMARGWPLLVLGVAISFAALVIALRSERLRIDEDAGRNVDLQVDELERGIQRYASILTALRVFFESSDEVDPAEFDHFTTQLVALGPGVQAVEWIPSISGPEERRVLEQKMKKTEPGFSVKIRQGDHALVTAPDEQREYLPIVYVYPSTSNKSVIGYDLVTGPTVQFLRRAESSRRMVATDAFQLMQAPEGSPGWILVAPAFDWTAASVIGASPRLRGFVQIVLRLEPMIDSISASGAQQYLDFAILDATPGARIAGIHARLSDLRDARANQAAALIRGRPFFRERKLSIVGRDWRIIASPTAEWVGAQTSPLPYVVFGLGLLLTGVMHVHVTSLRRRTENIGLEVRRKTEELVVSNRLLADEAAARRTTQSRMENVVHAADLGTWEWDVPSGLISFNAQSASMLGFKPEEYPTGPAAWEREIHPEDLPSTRRLVEEHLAGRSTQLEVVHRLRTKSGVYRWVQERGAVVERSADGQPVRVAGTRLDVHSRKLNEIELIRLASAVEQASEAVVLFDPAGVVQFVNHSFELRFGAVGTRLVGNTWDWVLCSGKHGAPPKFAAVIEEIVRSGTWSGPLEAVRPDGTATRDAGVVSPVRDDMGRLLSYVLVSRDKSREVQLEEQVRQAQKLEAIGLLAGGVAHDFNNLLQIIRGYASFATESGAPSPETLAHLRIVLDATEKAAQLTRQLLAFGRQQALEKSDLDLNSVTDDMLKLVRRVIGENIEIALEGQDPSAWVRADRGQLEQVFLNLCVNARDAMPEGGRLGIGMGVEQVQSGRVSQQMPPQKTGLHVVWTFRDNGCGMDAVTMTRIFEPFFSTKSKDRGTGLGLSVVYGIIQQHEGFIEVQSAPGSGTCFKVYLPATTPVHRGAAGVPVAAPGAGVGTVLLVEDEELVRALGCRVLQRAGFEVITAVDGADACERFSSRLGAIDVVVSDVVMPRMGGREAYERIRSLSPGVPFLFCSGYAAPDGDGPMALPAGCRMLSKPYLPSELVAQVRDLIETARRNRAPRA